jgi:hypothetical protein
MLIIEMTASNQNEQDLPDSVAHLSCKLPTQEVTSVRKEAIEEYRVDNLILLKL